MKLIEINLNAKSGKVYVLRGFQAGFGGYFDGIEMT